MAARRPPPNAPANANGLDTGGMREVDKLKDIESQELMKVMRTEIRTLRKQNEDEEKLINLYNLEKDKLNNLWVVAKHQVEDSKAEQMNKEREVKDLDENHIMTINLYKQKVKHLIFQNQDHHGEMKIVLEQNLKQLEDQHRVEERELVIDNRYLKRKLREQDMGNENFLFALKFDSDKNNTLARQEFEREGRELKAKYDLKMSKVRSEMEELRASKIKALETKKDDKIKEIINLFSHKYKDIKNYYNDITQSNLNYIKQLKTEINGLRKNEDSDKRKLLAVQTENKQLSGPLEEVQKELCQLEQDKKRWEETKELKNKERNEITNLEKLLKELD